MQTWPSTCIPFGAPQKAMDDGQWVEVDIDGLGWSGDEPFALCQYYYNYATT